MNKVAFGRNKKTGKVEMFTITPKGGIIGPKGPVIGPSVPPEVQHAAIGARMKHLRDEQNNRMQENLKRLRKLRGMS